MFKDCKGMRIAFLIRSLNYGGAERQLVVLAKGLYDRGHDVVVMVFYPGGPLENELHDGGVRVRVLDKGGRWDVLGFLLRLVLVLREEKPDVLHGYLGVPNILAVLMKPFFRRVRVVWGVRASNMDLSRYDWFARVTYKIECRLARFADLIIANSYAGKDYAVRHGFPKDKIVVIPNGIDTERFRPAPAARARVRAEWGVPESEILIGLVARLDPMKDHPTFLKAAALLAQERADVRFVCVGDGPKDYKLGLRKMAEDLGLANCLIWAKARGDMSSVYNALDIATSSSYSEGFSNVIAEAMACGVPCVVTDVGDSKLLLGNTGRTVLPASPQILAEALHKLIMLPKPERIAMGQLARGRILNRFSVSMLSEQTAGILLLQLARGDGH